MTALNDTLLSTILQVHGVLIAASTFFWTSWRDRVANASDETSTDSRIALHQSSARKRTLGLTITLGMFNLCLATICVSGLFEAGVRLSGPYSTIAATAVAITGVWLALVILSATDLIRILRRPAS